MTRLIYLSIALLPVFGAGSLQAQVIVANAGVKATEISKADLLDIFTGVSSNFHDGSRAVPTTLKGGRIHEQFLKLYVGKKETLFRGDWRVLVFSGKAAMPKAFDSEEQLLQYIGSQPGAIGYAGSPPENPRVKTLMVK